MKNPFIPPGMLLLLICFWTTCSNAQPVFDLVQGSYQMGPAAGPGTGSDGTEVNTLFLGLNIPVKLNARNRLLFHTFHDRRSIRLGQENNGQGIILHHAGSRSGFELRALSINTTIQHTLRDTTQNIVLAVSGRHYASDGTPISHLTLTPSVALLYTKRRNERFAWKAGVYVSREFFGFFWLPLLGVDWQAGKRLWVWGILPRQMVADFRLCPAWHLTFSYRGVTDSYRVGKKGWLAQLEGQLRIGNEFYVPRSPFVLVLESGRSLLRNIRINDSGFGEKIRPEVTDSWYLRAGLNWRFVTNEAFVTPGGKRK